MPSLLFPIYPFLFFFCLFISLLSTSLSSLTLIPASPTIQSSLLVGLLCVLAGHTESLHLNQSRLKFGWKPSMCSTHTHINTHTLLMFSTWLQQSGFSADLCQMSSVTVLLWRNVGNVPYKPHSESYPWEQKRWLMFSSSIWTSVSCGQCQDLRSLFRLVLFRGDWKNPGCYLFSLYQYILLWACEHTVCDMSYNLYAVKWLEWISGRVQLIYQQHYIYYLPIYQYQYL